MSKKGARRDPRLARGVKMLEEWGISSVAGTVVDPPLSSLTARVGEQPDADIAIAALLGDIPTHESAQFLIDWEAKNPDRRLKKEISRALYRLSQKGVHAERPEKDAGNSILTPIEPEGYLSPMDGRGDRLVWLVKSRVGGGFYFLSSLINEPQGMRSVEGTQVTRKMLRQARRDLTERHRISMIEAPWQYCDFLMHKGYERAVADGKENNNAVEQYPAIRSHVLTSPSAPQAVPLPEGLDREAVAADVDLLTTSAQLSEEPEIQRWLFDAEQAKAYTDKITSAQESPLVLNQFQQKDRVEDVIREAVSDLFTGQSGQTYARRLEETAWYFAATGRMESAKRALAVSLALREQGTNGDSIPFCEGLVRQSIGLHYKDEKQQEQEVAKASLIMKPSEFAAQAHRARQQRRRV